MSAARLLSPNCSISLLFVSKIGVRVPIYISKVFSGLGRNTFVMKDLYFLWHHNSICTWGISHSHSFGAVDDSCFVIPGCWIACVQRCTEFPLYLSCNNLAQHSKYFLNLKKFLGISHWGSNTVIYFIYFITRHVSKNLHIWKKILGRKQ